MGRLALKMMIIATVPTEVTNPSRRRVPFGPFNNRRFCAQAITPFPFMRLEFMMEYRIVLMEVMNSKSVLKKKSPGRQAQLQLQLH
jgi:hypothetical protein